MNKIIELEELCSEYYKFVYSENQDRIEDFTPEEIEEWLEEDFKFRAVNDEVEFWSWCYKRQRLDINELLDIHSICHIIKHIQKWYEENYGEDSIMDYKRFSPRYILNNFAYVTLHAMSMEDLKGLLIEEEEEEEGDGKICITCKSFQPYSKFAETINGEFVMTNECKGCYIEEEEEDIEPECYGKHCSETEGLKLCIGWNKYYCLDNKRFTENLYCNYCEKKDCYTNCVWCGENYKLTDMEYRCGGGFADKDAYGNACMFCKGCVNIIEKKLEC